MNIFQELAYKQYAEVVAHNRMMGSYEYYVSAMVIKAIESNAPEGAVYEKDGAWVTIDQVNNQEWAKEVRRIAEDIRGI